MFGNGNATPVVLIVDDDSQVRATLQDVLESHGYTVIDAASGREALDIIGRDETVRVIVTDVMMPGISGITLAKKAMELRPDIKVVLVSAYMRDPPGDEWPVLRKPFHTADLLQAVERNLGQQVL